MIFVGSGLTLVCAAVGLWNATYLDRVVAELRARAKRFATRRLARLSPLEWEHITLTAVYGWNLARRMTHAGPRPLTGFSPQTI